MPSLDFAFQQLPVKRRRLRIAVVTETYPPEINGVAMTLGRFVQALQDREHQVQLIRPRQGADDVPSKEANLEQLLQPGVPIPRYVGLRMGLPAKSRLRRIWSLKRPDRVHVVTEGPFGSPAAAKRLHLPVATDFRTNTAGITAWAGLSGLSWPTCASFTTRRG